MRNSTLTIMLSYFDNTKKTFGTHLLIYLKRTLTTGIKVWLHQTVKKQCLARDLRIHKASMEYIPLTETSY